MFSFYFFIQSDLNFLFYILCHVAEIARQAAQIKLLRKLEKQAMAQAAKEAKKQQGKQTAL